MNAILKREGSKILAKKQNNESIQFIETFLQGPIEGLEGRVLVKGFLSQDVIIFGIKNINMPMLCCNDLEADTFGYESDGDQESEIVLYKNTVFLVFPDITSPNYCFLVNEEGKVLSGSNIYDQGNLCLGEDLNPFIINTIEALIYNTANDDLYWRGDFLKGEWKNSGNTNYFEATNWPTMHQHPCTIPQEILDVCEHW